MCKYCGDAGYVYPLEDGKPDYSRVIPCPKCQTDEILLQKRLMHCQLPVESNKMELQCFRTKKDDGLIKSLRFAHEIVEGDIKWLTLIGKAGCGKTHLAVGICKEWVKTKSARYSFVPLLLKDLREGFELAGEDSYRSRFEKLCNVPLLVLDDLGVEKPSVWAQEQLQTIVHYRGLNGLPLVVTTNLPLDKLKGDDIGRIASRLKRETWCRVVTITASEFKQ